MKKFLFLFISLFLFSFSCVYADEVSSLSMNNYYSKFDDFYSDLQDTQSSYSMLISRYNSFYASSYPYFFVFDNGISSVDYTLFAFSSPFDFTININNPGDYTSLSWAIPGNNPYRVLSINSSGFIVDDYLVSSSSGSSMDLYYYVSGLGYVNYPIYASNVPLNISYSSNYNLSLDFPMFRPQAYDNYFQAFSISSGDNYPTYLSLIDGSYLPSDDFVEINLNDYSYVALSLKDYNSSPFETTFLVKGQLCLTPVYDYGMREKTSYYSGYQVDRCSPVYDVFIPTRVSILEQDISNHAIYYLKAYDLEIDNIVKIDSSVFDITYITSEDSDDPSVLVEGRYYPTIPYSSLSSSATISEEEGYISGESKNVFDISSDSNFIENLFSNPLQTLGNVWTSIITMFALVGSFISLLPVTLQTFLIAGFSVAIVLGVLKILL